MPRHGCFLHLEVVWHGSPTCSDTKQLSGHSPPRLPPVRIVSWPPHRRHDAEKTAFIWGFRAISRGLFCLTGLGLIRRRPPLGAPDAIVCTEQNGFPAFGGDGAPQTHLSPTVVCESPACGSLTGPLHGKICGSRGKNAGRGIARPLCIFFFFSSPATRKKVEVDRET
ncbi:hypothetical protein E2C01_056589 [Portunus trituberculatus]|uniref:Uncharacterized protein n=1 Tax=Portunus trituberculatus TaxID=210409 RepID=A0A5B7H0Z1_PORTR|nr:hypothetical protein [Portunus trituberculatus]